MPSFPPQPPLPHWGTSSSHLSLPVGVGTASVFIPYSPQAQQLLAQQMMQQHQGVSNHGLLGQSFGAIQGGAAQAQGLAAFQQGAILGLPVQASTSALLTGSGTVGFVGGHVVYYPDEPIPNTGIRAGEVIGWRAWKPNEQGFLTSLSASRVWAPNEPMDAETLNADLGIHAFKTLSRLLEFGTSYGCHPLILGQVEMWGDIIEHDLGYRAQYAAIISLERVINGPQDILRSLRRTYGVPWATPPEKPPMVDSTDWTGRRSQVTGERTMRSVSHEPNK